jgi:hypothetical protein
MKHAFWFIFSMPVIVTCTNGALEIVTPVAGVLVTPATRAPQIQ